MARPITIALSIDPDDLRVALAMLRKLQADAERRHKRAPFRAPIEVDRIMMGAGAVLVDAFDAAYMSAPGEMSGVWTSRGSIGGGPTTSEVGLHGAITHRLSRISVPGHDTRPALDTLERELTTLIADVRAARAEME